MPVSEARRVLKISRHPISLDRPVGESEDSYFGDFIEDDDVDSPVASATQEMLKERIDMVLKTLSYREREIIKLRYGIGDGYTYTLEEVGRIFKVTRERVRQVEAKAIRKLQHPVRARQVGRLPRSQIRLSGLKTKHHGREISISPAVSFCGACPCHHRHEHTRQIGDISTGFCFTRDRDWPIIKMCHCAVSCFRPVAWT